MSHSQGLSATTAFNILPIELNKAIAQYLDDDKDTATYRLICRATNDAIDADRLSFWRARFRKKYDFVEGRPNDQLRHLYQCRSKLLRCGTRCGFFRGHGKGEAQAVKILRGLIVESFYGASEVDEHGRLRSKNQAHLIQFILNSRLVNNDRRAPPVQQGERAYVKESLAAVKLVCSQFIFNLPALEHNIFAFDESQYAVYQPTSKAPIFSNDYQKVNLEWLLHNMNFFRHHMLNEESQTLFYKIDELDAAQKPSAWREPLRQGVQPLSRHWKGTYAFLETSEVQRLRKQGPGMDVYIDKNVDEGKIQSLKLTFARNGLLPDGRTLKWPSIFEYRLHSLRPDHVSSNKKPSLKTQGRGSAVATTTSDSSFGTNNSMSTTSIQFLGTGEDLDDDFQALGWLNPLPPQGDIPGWARITFMKHFSDDYDNADQDNLWAYEGAVLPGGRVILGRWWFASERNPTNREYSGPFILWAVDEPELDDGGGK